MHYSISICTEFSKTEQLFLSDVNNPKVNNLDTISFIVSYTALLTTYATQNQLTAYAQQSFDKTPQQCNNSQPNAVPQPKCSTKRTEREGDGSYHDDALAELGDGVGTEEAAALLEGPVVVVGRNAPEGKIAHAARGQEGGEPRLGGPRVGLIVRGL
jgi:hypothetical protein